MEKLVITYLQIDPKIIWLLFLSLRPSWDELFYRGSKKINKQFQHARVKAVVQFFPTS